MVDTETARTIVGVIGNVISFGLFLSPIPTFITIWRKKSVEAFKPDPYLATVLNCMMWVFYGLPLVTSDNILVVTINGIGLILELIYISIFFIYSSWGGRRKMAVVFLIEMIFFAGVVAVTMIALHTTGKRAMLVGFLCIIFNIAMYTAPLTVMRRVIQTKSVKYMPFFLSLANFLNGIIWAIYALLKFDPFVLVPNGLGALSGLGQLILFATYYKTTNWDEADKIPSSEVELPRGSANV